MKTKTQMRIGLLGAVLYMVYSICYSYLYFAQLNLFEKLCSLLIAVYVAVVMFSIFWRDLEITQSIFSIGWKFLAALLWLFTIGKIVSGGLVLQVMNLDLGSVLIDLKIFLRILIVFGYVVFSLWMIVRGLQRTMEKA